MRNTRYEHGTSFARRKTGDFTLLELLVVLVIVGLLAGSSQLGKPLDQCRLEAITSTEERLAALLQPSATEPKWDGPYLAKALPPDPWGHPYVFIVPGEHGERDLLS